MARTGYFVGDEGFAHQARRPGPCQQRHARLGRRGRGLDERDHGIDVGERNRETFEHVRPFTRAGEIMAENGARLIVERRDSLRASERMAHDRPKRTDKTDKTYI